MKESLERASRAAVSALRSYQYGNAAPDLAQRCADILERELNLDRMEAQEAERKALDARRLRLLKAEGVL